ARYVVPRSFNNRRLSSMPETPSGRKWGEDLMGIMLEFPDDERTLNLLMRSTYSPFARDVDPVLGSFTVASFDTPLKQDALAFAQAVEWNIKNLEAVRKAQRDPRIGDAFRRVREIAETEGLPSKDVVREILAETVGTVNERTAALLRRVVGLLDEGGSTLADVEAALLRRLQQLDASADWSEVFRVPTNFGADARDIVEKLRKKVRELRRQANFMASEVENVPEELVQFLADRGYRLVYGVDF